MDRKSKLRSGLLFGGVMALVFLLQNLFSQQASSGKNTLIIVVASLIGGLVAGLIFVAIMSWFIKSRYGARGIQFELEIGESVVFQSPANHNKGLEAVGGQLLLTNHRLVFKSHKVNIQNHELIIPLAEIAQVSRFKSLGIVNNGLEVTLRNGTNERFIVQQAESWIEKLSNRS
ncbi:MAG: hypothetical protein JST36_00575 [Bacteroidetes bacterium]|nr:hypothetical protein [Bacteroidota bacterium]